MIYFSSVHIKRPSPLLPSSAVLQCSKQYRYHTGCGNKETEPRMHHFYNLNPPTQSRYRLHRYGPNSTLDFMFNYNLLTSSSCSWRVRHVSLFLDPPDEVGPSISSSVVLYFFVRLVCILVLVLVVCLCPNLLTINQFSRQAEQTGSVSVHTSVISRNIWRIGYCSGTCNRIVFGFEPLRARCT